MISYKIKQTTTRTGFPKLMTDEDGDVFLIYEEGVGTILTNVKKSPLSLVGKFSNKWKMEQLKDFEGGITLKNGESV